MKIHLWLVLSFLITFSLPAAQLPADPRIEQGKLANGVTWLYRQHNNPPGRMALQIHVRTGSLNETEEQRGLAHFLEHMAFNGTENFPPGKLIPYFESIGMEFGAHLNAYTSFDQTSYMLFTPNVDLAQIDKALMVLSDYAFRISLLPEEIEKERGIVLEESRTGKNAQQRIRDKLWPELFKGTRFAKRLPIGEEAILASAKKEQFENYYKKWYRPENVTVVLVGDAPSKEILPLIEKWFGKATAEGEAAKQFTPEFQPFTEKRAYVVTDPEMAFCQVQMMNIRPGRPPTVTMEEARTELVEYIGSWIISRRFDDLVKKGTASYRNAGAYAQNFFNDAMLAVGFSIGEAKDWGKMLDEVVTEIKRATEYGFSDRELNLARKEILAEAERAIRTESTRNAQEVIGQIIDSVNEREPVLSAEQQFKLYQTLLPGISAAEVTSSFKEHFSANTFAYVVTMSDKGGNEVPSSEAVLARAKAALAAEVSKPEERQVPTNLLATLPKPGKVTDKSFDKDLGITSAWLENNVRVHHRFMDYKKDSVLVSIALAGGNIEETRENAGITAAASLVLNEPATSRLTSADVRDLMTGRNINVSGGSGGDHLLITVTGSPLNLDSGLQLAHALLTDGKIEESAFRNWRLMSLQRFEDREKRPNFKAQEAMESLLSNNDPRRVFYGKKELEALTLSKAQEWFDRIRTTAPIEVAVVGDIQWEEAQGLVEQYVGSLSKRERRSERIEALRKSPRPEGPLEKHVKVETVTPQAMALAGFAGSEARNIKDSRGLELASYILSSRLIKKIREELAIVYSIGANNSPSQIYLDAGRFLSGAPCDPAKVNQVNDEIHKIFEDFAKNGPTEEEVTNAKKQVDNSLEQGLREPSYWWGVLRTAHLRKWDVDSEKNIREDYQKFTGDEVKAIFAKYYKPTSIFRVTAVPTGTETAKQASAQ
ncbi:MAG: insulinase family protein [Verrucomicrobiota bacterium]|nr:insulinase family protein [Verrucomicrobiota bacterium]